MADGKKLKNVRTPRALGCYVTLAKPRAMEAGKEPEYSLALLWPKTTDLTEVIEAINDAAIFKFGPNAPKLLGGKLKTPLKDGNLKVDDDGNIDPIYKDKLYVNARSKQRVRIVDPGLNEIDAATVYSGCYFQAQLRFYPYEYKGDGGKGGAMSRGVGCGLQNLMLVGKGKRIDGREDPTEAFKDFKPDVMEDMEGGESLEDLMG